MNVEYSVVVKCYKCDAPILMSSGRQKTLLASKEAFFCCNGHSQVFTGRTEAEKKIAELQRDLDWARKDIRRRIEQAAFFKCVHPRCHYKHKVRKVVLAHMADCKFKAELKRLPSNAGPNAKNSKVWQS